MKLCNRLKPMFAALTAAAALFTASLSPMAAEAGDDYGTAAYSFLETLTSSYPSRTNEEGNRSQSLNDAGLWIKSQLESFGYEVGVHDYVHFNYTGTNYYVTKPGSSEKMIVVGAHYDSVATGGVDDNGSGVSVLLELAQRFADEETPCTIQFVFFDNEEHGGFVGSCTYINTHMIPNGLLDKTICYINLDSIGAGDRLHAYGGSYAEDGTLTGLWPYQLAITAAQINNVALYTIPDAVASNPDPDLAFQAPTRISGSDHHYFNAFGIPYVYFEAALWCDENGTGPDSTSLTCHYQTSDPAFASTGGQIMHTDFDNLARLNELLPGRIQKNLSDTSKVVSSMLMEITEYTPEDMASMTYTPTEEAPQTLPPIIEETEPPTEEELTTAAPVETTAAASNQPQSSSTLPTNHSLIIIIFTFAGAVILLLVGFIIYTTAAGTRRKRRNRRYNRNRRKKKKNRFD
ncbi:MAG: M28 family peptidase [Lachnospiraceae bacterium]|nr:M28 family peptidase [Lachnospiraceae bacterium]